MSPVGRPEPPSGCYRPNRGGAGGGEDRWLLTHLYVCVCRSLRVLMALNDFKEVAQDGMWGLFLFLHRLLANVCKSCFKFQMKQGRTKPQLNRASHCSRDGSTAAAEESFIRQSFDYTLRALSILMSGGRRSPPVDPVVFVLSK